MGGSKRVEVEGNFGKNGLRNFRTKRRIHIMTEENS